MAKIFNKITFEDEILEKAYGDYHIAREMMGTTEPAGLEDLSSIAVLFLNRTGKTKYLAASQNNDACIKIDVEMDGEKEPWIFCMTAEDSMVASLRENLAARVQPFSGVRLKVRNEYGDTELAFILGANPDVNVHYEEVSNGDLSLMLGEVARLDGREKINTVTERKIRRLFTNIVSSRMVKSSKSLDIETVPLSCVINAEDRRKFEEYAKQENLKCFQITPIAVDEKPIEKDKRISFKLSKAMPWKANQLHREDEGFAEMYAKLIADDSRRVTAELCNSIMDTAAVLMPYGGKYQLTPAQAIAQKLPVAELHTDNCMLTTWSCNPQITELSPYHAAYLAVVESAAKLVATGTDLRDFYLTIRTSFNDGQSGKLDKTVSALLGAFKAQMRLGVPANIETNLDEGPSTNKKLPPMLACFAVTDARTSDIVSPEFKTPGHSVVFLKPYCELNNKGIGVGLPSPDSLLSLWGKANELLKSGMAVSAYTPGGGGLADALLKMSLGNNIGCNILNRTLSIDELFAYAYGGIVLELKDKLLAGEIKYNDDEFQLVDLGVTNADGTIWRNDVSVNVRELIGLRSLNADAATADSEETEDEFVVKPVSYSARSWSTTLIKSSKPKVVIPVFPGTMGESDIVRAVREVGAVPELLVIKNYDKAVENKCAREFAELLQNGHVLFIPGGNYGGAAADISNDFAVDFLRKKVVKEAVMDFAKHRRGLICGVAEGYGILLRLGLLPFGRYLEGKEEACLLELMAIDGDRFANKIANVRIATNASPWLRHRNLGELESVHVKSCEYRLKGNDSLLKNLLARGQVVSQFVDADGIATMNPMYNPGANPYGIEGLISPDGRIIGRLGHCERSEEDLYLNVPGNYNRSMLEHMMKYFK